MKKTPFKYSDKIAPPFYVCSKCGKHGVKLWRAYQTFKVELICSECLCKEDNIDIKTLNEEGQWWIKSLSLFSDSINWHVPAVPDEEGYSYWGYTSVPMDGVNWWRNLPNR